MKKELFLIVSIILVAACVQNTTTGLGTLQIKVTDAGNISSLVLTVSKIDVHLAGNDTTSEAPVNQTDNGAEANDTSTSGWITVFSGTKTIDLISVKSITDILTEGNLQVGRYTQIRLLIDSATAVIDGNTVTLKVPSNTIKFVHTFVIVNGNVSSLVLDFNADNSVVKAGNSYILKPVAKVLTEFSGKSVADANTIKNQQAADSQQKRQGGNQNPTHTRPAGSTTFSGSTSITLISPVGGEVWTAGSTQTLSWTSTGVAHYQLWYTTDLNLPCGSGSWTLLQSHPYPPTTFSWTLPALNSDTVRVSIEGHTPTHMTLGYTCSGGFSVH